MMTLLYIVLVLAVCIAIAYAFRLLGQRAGTAGSRKLFRQMPLTAAFGIFVILVYAVVALGAPVIAPYGEAEIFVTTNAAPGQVAAHLLGTDQIGRDLLTRLIYGARNTVGIALITAIITFVLGATLGFLAATLGGWVDQVLSRAVDVLMAIPNLIFALLLITIVGQSTINMILILAVLDSTRVFRLARAVGVNIVVMDYIEAAKLRGETLPYLIFREILPNATAPLLAEFGLRFCFVFLAIAALSRHLQLSDAQIVAALSGLSLTGRMEQYLLESVGRRQGVRLILDVAHNPAGAAFLCRQLKQRFPGQRFIALCGMLADKDAAGVAAALEGIVGQWLTVDTTGPRGQSAARLAERLTVGFKDRIAGPHAPIPARLTYTEFGEACAAAVSCAGAKDAILAFGSFSLVEQARNHLEALSKPHS